MKLAKAYSGTQSVVRALRLLKLFHGARPDLSFAQIQSRSGLNRSTAFRMLTALEAEGMIERDPHSDGYRLGPQIAALGQCATANGTLGDLARGEMAELAEQTQGVVVLGMRDGSDKVVMGEGHIPAAASAVRAPGSMPQVAGSIPAHASSIGKVLLANFSADERSQVLSSGLPKLTEKTQTDVQGLAKELDSVLNLGFAISIEEMEENFNCVSVPVFDADGKVVAALGVGGPTERMPEGRLAEMSEDLKAASARITRNLGGVAVA